MEQRKAGRTYPSMTSPPTEGQKGRGQACGRGVSDSTADFPEGLQVNVSTLWPVPRRSCEQEKDLFVQQDKKSQCLSRLSKVLGRSETWEKG